MSDRNGKIFCTSIASLSHISKYYGFVSSATEYSDQKSGAEFAVTTGCKLFVVKYSYGHPLADDLIRMLHSSGALVHAFPLTTLEQKIEIMSLGYDGAQINTIIDEPIEAQP